MSHTYIIPSTAKVKTIFTVLTVSDWLKEVELSKIAEESMVVHLFDSSTITVYNASPHISTYFVL